MVAETFQVTEPFKVFRSGADGTTRFFLLPAEAIITVVAESVVSGRVQILYQQELYVTFQRNLILHLKRQRELGAIG